MCVCVLCTRDDGLCVLKCCFATVCLTNVIFDSYINSLLVVTNTARQMLMFIRKEMIHCCSYVFTLSVN